MQTHGSDKSGFLLLEGNREAMDWRLALIDSAERSLDLQYFIWEDDAAAGLIMERVLLAAARGVRVRVLVDDLALTGNTRDLATLSLHPDLDIKIFNPTRAREGTFGRLIEWMFKFGELNRRMHNKMLLADASMAIVGGRNLGNAYFGLSSGYNFRDLDVLVAGAVVGQIEEAFEEYWESDPAVPAGELSKRESIDDLPALVARLEADFADDHAELAETPFPLEVRDWSDAFEELPSALAIGQAAMIQDEPVLHKGEQRRLTDSLAYLTDDLQGELIIATPYLIPVDDLLERLGDLGSNGAEVWVLTGSMGSNNHTIAHSHYKKYRRSILEQGIGLYEFRRDPSAPVRALSDTPPVEAEFISLHIKAFVADRRRMFLGSLNLDPRAIVLNTENGLLIECEALGEELAAMFDRMHTPPNAWHVTMDEDGDLRWSSSEGVVTMQPARSRGQRVADFFFGLLPIESQL